MHNQSLHFLPQSRLFTSNKNDSLELFRVKKSDIVFSTMLVSAEVYTGH
jgi:hypothetical protein